MHQYHQATNLQQILTITSTQINVYIFKWSMSIKFNDEPSNKQTHHKEG